MCSGAVKMIGCKEVPIERSLLLCGGVFLFHFFFLYSIILLFNRRFSVISPISPFQLSRFSILFSRIRPHVEQLLQLTHSFFFPRFHNDAWAFRNERHVETIADKWPISGPANSESTIHQFW
ncbi:unnamed protein product, partial [Mesorhabditis belari]|uniref:Uncharacterized protein n=1 Tax=Mesorhabditis belari TaxID=2138241 RepID=A0AAF3EXD2_9BILA